MKAFLHTTFFVSLLVALGSVGRDGWLFVLFSGALMGALGSGIGLWLMRVRAAKQ